MVLRPLPRFLTVISFCALVSAVPVLSSQAQLSIDPYPLGDQAVEDSKIATTPVSRDPVIKQSQEKVPDFEKRYVPDAVRKPIASEPYTAGDEYIEQSEYKSMVREFHEAKSSRPEYLNETVLEEPYIPSFVTEATPCLLLHI